MLHSVSAYLLLLHKLTFAHPHMPSATTASFLHCSEEYAHHSRIPTMTVREQPLCLRQRAG